jgi:hypothetical protein
MEVHQHKNKSIFIHVVQTKMEGSEHIDYLHDVFDKGHARRTVIICGFDKELGEIWNSDYPWLKKYIENYSSPINNQWDISMMKLYRVLIYKSICLELARSNDVLIIVVITNECNAYLKIGATTRGYECGRCTSKIVIENIKMISDIVCQNNAKWTIKYLDIPHSKKVIVTFHSPKWKDGDNRDSGRERIFQVTVFSQKNGDVLDCGDLILNDGKFRGDYFAMEALWVSKRGIWIYDACIMKDISVRKENYNCRMGMVKELIYRTIKPTKDSLDISILPDLMSVEDVEVAELILYINNSEPCNFYAGGNVLQWKNNGLPLNQYVLFNNNGRLQTVMRAPWMTDMGYYPERRRYYQSEVYAVIGEGESQEFKFIRKAKRTERLTSYENIYNSNRSKYVIDRELIKSYMNGYKNIEQKKESMDKM